MEGYIRGKVLGKGSFGSAILVQSKKDGKNYVIKEIDISKMPAVEREASKQEAQVRIHLLTVHTRACHHHPTSSYSNLSY